MDLVNGNPVRYALADGSVAYALITGTHSTPDDVKQALDLRIVLANGQTRVDNNVPSAKVVGGAPYWFPFE
jgi:hypothetical protein